MTRLRVSRIALATGVAAALLAGCGGTQTGAMPQSSTTNLRNAKTRLPIRPNATGDLLFISGGQKREGGVFLWSYPQARFVARTTGVHGGFGMCSDSSGNVWAAGGSVERFDHSGNWLGSLQDKNGEGAVGCAVDPTTGNVAVTNQDSGTIAVYAKGTGAETDYSAPFTWGYFCGYDDKGNLYADGTDNNQGELVELKKGDKSVKQISLAQSITGKGGVQWDGRYVAVEASDAKKSVTIYQISVSGSTGTIVGSTQLVTPTRNPYGRQFWIQGDSILRPFGGRFDDEVGSWPYPQGGQPRDLIRRQNGHGVRGIGGLTVSVAPR